MTREQILSEPAGRRMDAWVAYSIFGWRWRNHANYDLTPDEVRRGILSTATNTLLCEPPFAESHWLSGPLEGFDKWFAAAIDGWDKWFSRGLPSYSTDIASAWEVVDKTAPHSPDDNHTTQLTIVAPIEAHHVSFKIGNVQAWAPTAPLAICRAALLTGPI